MSRLIKIEYEEVIDADIIENDRDRIMASVRSLNTNQFQNVSKNDENIIRVEKKEPVKFRNLSFTRKKRSQLIKAADAKGKAITWVAPKANR